MKLERLSLAILAIAAFAGPGVAQAKELTNIPITWSGPLFAFANPSSFIAGMISTPVPTCGQGSIVIRHSTTGAEVASSAYRDVLWRPTEPGQYQLVATIPLAVSATNPECNGNVAVKRFTLSVTAPMWSMTQQGPASTAHAPANVMLRATPSDPSPFSLKGLKYTWTVGAREPIITTGPVLAFRSNFALDDPVTLRITSDSGTEFFTEGRVSLNPPTPLDATARIMSLTRWKHAPINVAIVPRILNLMPGEKLTSQGVYVNGVAVANTPGRPYLATLTTPGVHTVQIEAVTSLMRDQGRTYEIVVPEADVPTCTLEATANPRYPQYVSYTLTAASTTGAITGYSWSLNGVKSTARNKSVMFKKQALEQDVTAEATSDAGLTCTARTIVPSISPAV